MTRLQAVAFGWVAFVVGLLGIHVVIPQRSGAIALTQVVEPYLVLVAAAAALLTLPGRRRWSIAATAILAIVVIGRYGPIWVSFPTQTFEPLRVQTWNLLGGDEGAARSLAGLSGTTADIVGVQELQSAAASALDDDASLAARLPHRVLVPSESLRGMGLLSRYPIIEHESWSDPPMLRVVLAMPGGERVTAIVVHPLPARIGSVMGLPVSLDTRSRDEAIARIRELVDAELAAGRPFVLLGDLNLTEREPAYAEISAGLRDAHLDAGFGPGSTWRPARLAFLPFGVLRIDYVLTSPSFLATESSVDCQLPSDHCRLSVTLVSPLVRLDESGSRQ